MPVLSAGPSRAASARLTDRSTFTRPKPWWLSTIAVLAAVPGKRFAPAMSKALRRAAEGLAMPCFFLRNSRSKATAPEVRGVAMLVPPMWK